MLKPAYQPISEGPAPPYLASKTLTFDGTSGLGLAGTNAVLFTVTGQVLIFQIVPFCTTDLTEALATAQVSLGVVGSTVLWIALTNSVLIDANEFWVTTTPTPNGIALPTAMGIGVAITDNIVIACATQNTNGGVIRVDALWRPLSSDGNVVPA